MDYLRKHTTDAQVRQEVLSLLDHDHLAEPFFSNVLESAASSVLSDLDLRPGTRIGAYTIERMLGFGGMGTVYLAKRADGAFEQTVAMKVIQAPHPTPLLLERFQQERQILARLNHPNIARLLDGGETPAGSPFFVMEYVSGEEIDRYCDNHGLDLKSRLRLFLEISDGVRYAHENLVVHRDLKPSVPGTTKARELVIKTAQQYLDRLALEAGRDPELIHELADAYGKLGAVQGSPVDGNTGDVKSALVSYRRSVALRDSVGDERATSTPVRVAYLESLSGLANSEAISGDPARVMPLCAKAVAVAEVWLQNGSNDSDLLSAAANTYAQLATRQRESGDFEAAMTSSKRSVPCNCERGSCAPRIQNYCAL